MSLCPLFQAPNLQSGVSQSPTVRQSSSSSAAASRAINMPGRCPPIYSSRSGFVRRTTSRTASQQSGPGLPAALDYTRGGATRWQANGRTNKRAGVLRRRTRGMFNRDIYRPSRTRSPPPLSRPSLFWHSSWSPFVVAFSRPVPSGWPAPSVSLALSHCTRSSITSSSSSNRHHHCRPLLFPHSRSRATWPLR